ncbi:hypothetical protein [Halalkalibaculum sp. DA384]|uniref:hypothetical protein n=1 Tax=Halalkalibaculum sp. DA384 TaxID=3373606 RepID=UPI00375472F7
MDKEINEISFNQFKLTPRDLRVEDLKPGLILKFKTELPKERHEELIQLYKTHDFFEVSIGDSETKIMRFGRPFYSEHDNIIKYHIILVSKEYDENVNGDRPVHDSDPNMGNIIAFNNAYIEELENLLIDKKNLNREEIQKLRTKSEKNIPNKKFEFGKLDDVDKYAS